MHQRRQARFDDHDDDDDDDASVSARYQDVDERVESLARIANYRFRSAERQPFVWQHNSSGDAFTYPHFDEDEDENEDDEDFVNPLNPFDRLPSEQPEQPLDPLPVVAPTIVAPVAVITLTLAVPVTLAVAVAAVAVTTTIPPADIIDNLINPADDTPMNNINLSRNTSASNAPVNIADDGAKRTKPTKPHLSRARGAALAVDTSNTRSEVSAFRNPYVLTPGPTTP